MTVISASPGERVLILVQNLSVPFDRRVWQEATSLTAAGYHVSVICPMGSGRDEEPFALIDGVEIHRFPLRSVTSGKLGYPREYSLTAWHMTRLVRKLLRSGDFDIVQACNPPDFLLVCALAARRAGAAFIFDHHDLVPELYLSRFGRGKDLGYRLVMAAERLTMSLADVVMSTNGSYRDAALKRGGKEPSNVFVVRSAPDLSHFTPVEPEPELRRGKQHLVAYLGVMGPQDGVDHALRALAELAGRRDDWHAIFVGAGDVFEAMQALSHDLGLADRVEFTGRISNERLRAVLSSADVGIAPDPLNPLNDVSTMNKIVEYMALGLPVASYDLREARVSAGDAAEYAMPNDPAALADAIGALLDDPVRRAQMAVIGRDRLATELSWEQSDVQLRLAYRRAIEVRDERRARRGSGRLAIAGQPARGPER